MYAPINVDDEEFMLRPMTCPHHFELYLDRPRSYRELPMRIAELAKLYRYEQSGELFGLMRVRSMQMNDAHIYCTDEQQVDALRFDNWKLVFMEQRAPGTLRVWAEPFTTLRLPKIYNLRADPFEAADDSSNFWKYRTDRMFVMVPIQELLANFMATFKEYPPSQKVGSWTK